LSDGFSGENRRLGKESAERVLREVLRDLIWRVGRSRKAGIGLVWKTR
jgi:hypothetical protein